VTVISSVWMRCGSGLTPARNTRHELPACTLLPRNLNCHKVFINILIIKYIYNHTLYIYQNLHAVLCSIFSLDCTICEFILK